MDSKDFGGLFRGDIIHLKPLKSTKSTIVDLSKDKRFGEGFSHLVLRPIKIPLFPLTVLANALASLRASERAYPYSEQR